MAADEPSGARPPVVLRIKLRYEDLETMVARFAPNVGKSGLFLPTKSIQPVGTEVKFELRLADDKPVLVGLGRVRASRVLDPANPKIAFGMTIELLRVNREGRDLILKMLERRRLLGLPEVALPLPEDIDAARVETTGVRDTVSAVVPPPLVTLETPAESLMTAPRRQSGPIGVAKDLSVKLLAPEPTRRKRPAVADVIASARSGPVAVAAMPELDADVDVGAAMVRARALAAGADLDAELEALRDAGAAPIEISIEAASAELARQLGGLAVDRRDRSARWAPPPPVVIEAVAAAVVEPAIIAAIAVAPIVAVAVAPVVAEPVAVAVVTVPVAVVESPAFIPLITEVEHAEPDFALPDGEAHADDSFAVSDAEIVEENAASQITEAPHEPALVEVGDDPEELFERVIARPLTRPPPMIDDDVDPEEFEQSDATVGPSLEGHASNRRLLAERLADQRNEQLEDEIEDEIEQLSETDLEDASEHTYAGVIPVDPHSSDSSGPDFGSFAVTPYPQAAAHELADRLDAHLADAEAEAEAELGFDRDVRGPAADHIVDRGELAAEPEYIEEVDDYEILAEADAADADLLSADGERDVSRSHPVVDPEPTPLPAPVPAHVFDPDPDPDPEPLPAAETVMRPSYLDFASRLELGDEHAPADEPDPLAGFDESAEDSIEFDAPHAEFSSAPATAFEAPAYADPTPTPVREARHAPRAFDESDLESHAAPRYLRAPTPTPARAASPGPARKPGPSHARPRVPTPTVDHLDLESALEALDVDLDDLSVPGTAITPGPLDRLRQPTPSRPQARPAPSPAPLRAPRPAPSPAPLTGRAPSASPARAPSGPVGKRPPRATSDDGILIDFDDDD